jgi:hypothetical protein
MMEQWRKEARDQRQERVDPSGLGQDGAGDKKMLLKYTRNCRNKSRLAKKNTKLQKTISATAK